MASSERKCKKSLLFGPDKCQKINDLSKSCVSKWGRRMIFIRFADRTAFVVVVVCETTGII